MASSSEPCVSVVIPCYNQGGVLAEAIDSALAQTYANREVIVVDDGSSDDTAAVAASYGSRIRLIRQANRGLPAARNAAIAHARGTIIGLLDADDRWLPEKLAIEVPYFADGRVGVVHGSYRKFPATHPRSGVICKTDGAVTPFHDLLERNLVGAPVSAMFRRSVYERVARFDEALKGAEDWDLWIRMATQSRVVGSAPLTSEYRLSDDSMSRNYGQMYRCLLRVAEKNGAHHPGCAECRHAVRRARRHARSYYCDAAARDAYRAREAGQPFKYIRLRLGGLLRNPYAATRIVPGLARRAALRFGQ